MLDSALPWGASERGGGTSRGEGGRSDLAGVVEGLQVEGAAHLGHGQGHFLQPLCKGCCCPLPLLLVPASMFHPFALEPTRPKLLLVNREKPADLAAC